MRRLFTYQAIIGLALVCTSCGTNKSDPTYPASGTVTCNGAPAPGAAVLFFQRGSALTVAPAALAIVKDDGSFEIKGGGVGRGLLPGDYDVLIEWREVIRDRKGRQQRGPDKLKGRYANRKSPLLQFAVEAGANNIPPFELASR